MQRDGESSEQVNPDKYKSAQVLQEHHDDEAGTYTAIGNAAGEYEVIYSRVASLSRVGGVPRPCCCTVKQPSLVCEVLFDAMMLHGDGTTYAFEGSQPFQVWDMIQKSPKT